ATVDGLPAQIVSPTLSLELPLVDLQGYPAAEREAEARRRVDEDARRPFDLLRGPLLRATLLRLAPEDHVLFLCVHHIVADGCWRPSRRCSAATAGRTISWSAHRSLAAHAPSWRS